MPHRTPTQPRAWSERLLSLLLAAVLLIGAVPGLTLTASAEHWADEYLDQLVDWGVIRPDQASDPDRPITRADFMAIVNRAYGYTKKAADMPFTDVDVSDWFYDDVSIAYNTGYISGTSPTTVSPNYVLNREMAVFILGKNMMLKETPGEDMSFSDSRDISTWARGVIKTAIDTGIASGYPSNRFAPEDKVTLAQMAVFVTHCIGTPVQQPGEYSLGGVFDNVTITSSDVTLKDTTIAGDLYVSGGVGLGGVKLENVTVHGRIVVSGTGESQGGEASVVLRNVTADEMLVDNMRNNTVTIRADGITDIAKTIVRTPAYLEDNNTDDKGLMNIELDAEPGTHLTLAGRIKEVVNKTPNSTIQVALGTVAKLTVDEDATNSTVQIDRNTEVKELNLDVATNVTGEGDIEQLNINAPGCVVSMLPEHIYIRPGLTANIAGVIMDHLAAEEGSTDPRLLSGYPAAKDIAPTGLRADFSGNKRGTVYWAVSSISDGSIGEEDLISPPSYGSRAVRNGSVSAPAGDTVVSAQITGLTSAGSYYLSALLVDEQNQRSPVKVISFTTPDNTVPAFAQGYPYMSLVTDTLAQVTVMPTKTCKLYYAVLPRGAQAPTADDMKTASVTGNLGYGVVDVTKNTERVINVSNQLEELKDYTLYLWLTDANGANSSAVQALQFTTEDRTPPVFDPDPDYNSATVAETAVTLTAGLNETGTIFWAVVPEGTAYPLPNSQSNPLDKDNILDDNGSPVSAKLDSEYAKLQVSSGRNATRRGQVAVPNGDTDVTIPVTGLNTETAYDFYYVARDTAGNYSAVVKKITIRTLDNSGPVVRQYFTDYQGEDETRNPMANSDIILEFNENITAGNSRDLLSLYNISTGKAQSDEITDTQAKRELYTALSNYFKLYQVNTATNASTEVPSYGEGSIPSDVPWVNYNNVVVRSSSSGDGKIEVVFPSGSAVGLASGARYHFELTNIRDNANNQTSPTTLNPKNCVNTNHVLDYFDTVFALVNLAPGDGVSSNPSYHAEGGEEARVDTSFLMSPQSTKNADPNVRYEIIILSDAAVDFDLYYRMYDANDTSKTSLHETDRFTNGKLAGGSTPDSKGWVYLGNKATTLMEGMDWDSATVNHDFLKVTSGEFPNLVNLDENATYEFAISVTRKDSNTTYENWSGQVNFRAYVVASGTGALWNFVHGGQITPEDIDAWDTGVTSESGRSIGTYGTSDYVSVRATFVDSVVPKFTSGPKIDAGDTFANITIALDREATIYYVIAPRDRVLDTHITVNAPVDGVTKTYIESLTDEEDFWKVITKQTNEDSPGALNEYDKLTYYTVEDDYPPALNLSNPSRYYRSYPYGTFSYESMGVQDRIEINKEVDGNVLEPETEYYVYMVVRGTSAALSQVYVYNFTTTATAAPKIMLDHDGPGLVRVTTPNAPGDLDYVIYAAGDVATSPALRVLNDKLANYALAGDLPTAYATYKDDEGTTQDMTVLQALLTDYNDREAKTGNSVADAYFPESGDKMNGYSVFDIYAGEGLKNTISRLIQQASGGLATSSGTGVRTEQDDTGRVLNTTEGMERITPYYVLVVGQHPSSDDRISGYTFKGIGDVVIPDQDPPKATSASAVIYQSAAGSSTFNGSITIQFDKELYWMASQTATGDPKEIHQKCSESGDHSDAKDAKGLAGSSGKILDLDQARDGLTTVIRFGFEGLRSGSDIVFIEQGLLSNASGSRTDTKVTCTIKNEQLPSQSGIPLYGYYMEIKWGDTVIGTSELIQLTGASNNPSNR